MPGYSQARQAKGMPSVGNMPPFEDAVFEPRAPLSAAEQLLCRVRDFIHNSPTGDPRLQRDRLRKPSGIMAALALRRTRRRKRLARRRGLAQRQEGDEPSSEEAGERRQARRWLRKSSRTQMSSPVRSKFHSQCGTREDHPDAARCLPPEVVATIEKRRRNETRKWFLAQERKEHTTLQKRQQRLAVPQNVLLHVRHWLLDIDADLLGFDREAEFAMTADAKYVIMPEVSCGQVRRGCV